MMEQYRKKPIVVEAFQMTEARRWDNSEWPDWLHEAWNREHDEAGCLTVDKDCPDAPGHASAAALLIVTLEGPHKVTWGDFIIRGIRGELYPCKPDIFEATYEKVNIEERLDAIKSDKAVLEEHLEAANRELAGMESEMEVAFTEGVNTANEGDIPDNNDGTPGSIHDAFMRWRSGDKTG